MTILVVPATDDNIISMSKQCLNLNINSDCSKVSKSLILLSKVFNNQDNELVALRESGSLARHQSLSFLVLCKKETALSLLSETTLALHYIPSMNPDFYFCVISGTVLDFKVSLIDCLVPRIPYETRLVMSAIYEYLLRFGYKHLFLLYSQRTHADNTILLERR